jgi:putative addiction module component (TIGR02574 family)
MRYGAGIMTVTEIRNLPLNEKLQIMEAIWEDLRSRAEAVPVPDWHKKLLDARRKAVDEGREGVFDWDEVKKSLGTGRE